MSTALTEATKERVRHHLGYPNVDVMSAVPLGFPATQQPGFLVESAMERVNSNAVGRIEATLAKLEAIEAQMMEANHRLKAQQLGELKLRNSNEEPTEQDKLREEYLYWAQELASDLGVPLNILSPKFRHLGYGGAGGMNVRVLPS